MSMVILTLVSPTRCGLGGVDGEVAGVVGVAGVGLHLIGTPGGRTIH